MRWACILLPHLALDGVLRGCADPAAPRVLLTGPVQRRVLHAVNPAAAALGLQRGMSMATAQALASNFIATVHDPAEEARWHTLLAAWAYRFSSQVSLQMARALIVEIKGSLGLFGPWPRFEQRLRSELGELGFRHRIVLAPNPVAARALANVHDGLAVDEAQLPACLAALPLRRCGFDPGVAEALSRMGLRSLRQVLDLPREGIARRFPPQVLQHIDALLGERPYPLQPYRPPDVFEQRIELGYEVESSQALLFPLRRLALDLGAYLAGRDGSVQHFTLRLEHEDLPASEVVVGLLATERDPALLFEIARSRLEQVQLPAPVRALCLHADQLPAFVPVHRELFDQRPQQSMPWEQLRERLRARLGEQAVHGLRVHADHRPEQAWRNESEARRQPVPAPGATRPGWLLPEAVPWPGAEPLILQGPERIESGWWDGADQRRDYYRVSTRFGQQAWVWREVGGDGGFMLQGWFG